MNYFALVDDSNVVMAVMVGRDEDNEVELSERTGQKYLRCCAYTIDGVYYDPETDEPSEDQSKAFRVNFPSTYFTFYPEIGTDGAFVCPQPFPSWTLNLVTGLWEPPYARPGEDYEWSELTQEWIQTA